MSLRARDLPGWVRIGGWLAVLVAWAEIAQLAAPARKRPELFWKALGTWGRRALGPYGIGVDHVERIPADEPVILVSNHQGYLDIPLLHAVVPCPFRWLAKQELFRTPIVGPALRGAGAIGVDRQDRRAGALAVKLALAQLAEGRNVMIFAEGTWGDRQGRMLPFKKGVITLARRSGCRVVPMTIVGSSDACPSRTRNLRRAPMRVVVHPPLGPDSWEGVDDDAWTERLRAIIGSALPCGTAYAEVELELQHAG